MKIKNKRPLFWFMVKMFFPSVEWNKVAFTFGDTIYSSQPLSKAILGHELVHIEQHRNSKLFAMYIFIRYFFSKKFRLELEIPAYQAEWKIIKKTEKDTDKKRVRLALSISSKLYGNMISYDEALKLFK